MPVCQLRVGRDGHVQSVGGVVTRVAANRVDLVHRGLEEWYVAGPLGIEQGFTVGHRPPGGGSLSLANLSGSLRPELTKSGVLFAGRGRARLRYGNPVALDDRGRRLPATLRLAEGSLVLQVDDRGARYPVRIDPLIQQGAKLTGTGETGAGEFGVVTLSADGNTALVGGPADNGNVGSVWVFVRSGGTWIQQGPKLIGSDETGAGRFGSRVAVSADGNTALVAAPDDDFEGAVFVFTRSGGVWSQQGSKLFVATCFPSLCANNSNGFGSDVAVSADGNTALIGGVARGTTATALVYTRSGGTWTQQGTPLTGSGGSTSNLEGTPVALSADGNTALLGGPESTRTQGITTYGNVGSAWVYTRSAATWSQQAELTAGDQTTLMRFGGSVALSADGKTALIGAPSAGTAFGFARSGTTWSQQGPVITGSGATGMADFGAAVALSGDGTAALIGGPGVNGNLGAIWDYAFLGGTWVQQGPKLSGLGWIGALPTAPSSALVGNPSDANGVGAVWPFVSGHALSVALAGTGLGSVTGDGISCSPTCAQAYADGTSVSLIATASPASTFSGWSGGGCSGTGACTIQIAADTIVTATFSAQAPALTSLSITPRKFKLGGRLVKRHCVVPTHANRRRPRCRRPVGMKVSYELSLDATVTFTIAEKLRGRLVRGRCVAATHANRKHRPCARLVPLGGELVQQGRPGTNRLALTGRIGGRKVGPGSYELTATPSANGRLGPSQATAFTLTQ